MLSIFERLRAAIPTATFHPPASEAQIVRVERLLGSPFPDWLRELYLRCNGISGAAFGDPYLYPLETGNEHSLLGQNEYFRSEWDDKLDWYKEVDPTADWENRDIRDLLIIGRCHTINWAIEVAGGRQIIRYSLHGPGRREVLAEDLVEMCEKTEAEQREIHEKHYRGRQPYRREAELAPPRRDIDRIMDRLNFDATEIPRKHGIRVSPPWRVDRAISQRPGETGELYILHGGGMSIRLISRDGNFPFVMKIKWRKAEPSCTVNKLSQVLARIEGAQEEVRSNQRRLGVVLRIWNQDAAPFDDELFDMSEILCGRDDRRMEEDNALGA